MKLGGEQSIAFLPVCCNAQLFVQLCQLIVNAPMERLRNKYANLLFDTTVGCGII